MILNGKVLKFSSNGMQSRNATIICRNDELSSSLRYMKVKKIGMKLFFEKNLVKFYK